MEPTIQEYLEKVTEVANYGLEIPDLETCRGYLQYHEQLMDDERRQGKPKGLAVWTMYLTVYKNLIAKHQELEARRDHPDFFWTYRNVR